MSKHTPLHQYFSRLPADFSHDAAAKMIELAHDVSDGVALCLELLSEDDLRRQNDEAPMLGIGDTTRLMRLAVASLRMLRDEAHSRIENTHDWIEKRGDA